MTKWQKMSGCQYHNLLSSKKMRMNTTLSVHCVCSYSQHTVSIGRYNDKVGGDRWWYSQTQMTNQHKILLVHKSFV